MQIQFNFIISKLERESKPIKSSFLFLKQVTIDRNTQSVLIMSLATYKFSNTLVFQNFFLEKLKKNKDKKISF